MQESSRIAITGASGLLGVNLLQLLTTQNICPRVLLQYGDKLKPEGMFSDQIPGDVLNLDSLKQCFDNVDVVYHLAAVQYLGSQNTSMLHEVNVQGTRNVVTACLDRKVKHLVYVCSIRALSPEPANLPVDESRPLRNANEGFPYDCSKANAMREVEIGQQNGLHVVSLFPTSIIGPYDYHLSYMSKFLLALYHQQFRILCEGGFHFTDSRDVAAACISAYKNGRNGDRFLLAGKNATFLELAALVEEVTGRKMPKRTISIRTVKILSPIIIKYLQWRGLGKLAEIFSNMGINAIETYRNINCAKAVKDLNYHPRPLRETIQDMFTWFAKEDLL